MGRRSGAHHRPHFPPSPTPWACRASGTTRPHRPAGMGLTEAEEAAASWAMMLDNQKTADDLIAQISPDPAATASSRTASTGPPTTSRAARSTWPPRSSTTWWAGPLRPRGPRHPAGEGTPWASWRRRAPRPLPRPAGHEVVPPPTMKRVFGRSSWGRRPSRSGSRPHLRQGILEDLSVYFHLFKDLYDGFRERQEAVVEMFQPSTAFWWSAPPRRPRGRHQLPRRAVQAADAQPRRHREPAPPGERQPWTPRRCWARPQRGRTTCPARRPPPRPAGRGRRAAPWRRRARPWPATCTPCTGARSCGHPPAGGCSRHQQPRPGGGLPRGGLSAWGARLGRPAGPTPPWSRSRPRPARCRPGSRRPRGSSAPPARGPAGRCASRG